MMCVFVFVDKFVSVRVGESVSYCLFLHIQLFVYLLIQYKEEMWRDESTAIHFLD